MNKTIPAFTIKKNGKTLSYYKGETLDLKDICLFFKRKGYSANLEHQKRHIVGVLKKGNQEYFLKLSTCNGINETTFNEYQWNYYFNKIVLRENSYFCVPKNIEKGYYNNKYFYFISEYFNGELLGPLNKESSKLKAVWDNLDKIIELSELIEKLPLPVLHADKYHEGEDYKEKFLNKVVLWYKSIPENIINKYDIDTLHDFVKKKVNILNKACKHGDFTPWHMIILKQNKLGLIDGEHAMSESVEGYDICYLIQRLFSVLKNTEIAKELYSILLKRNYSKEKLEVILYARAIGGFTDESLSPSPNYTCAEEFKSWVLNLI